MFEKEAEEYAEETKTEKEIEIRNTVHDWGQESLSPNERKLFGGIQDRKRAREQSFKDGAEFGYNKANEWQYPSKGKYPKENKRYLCKINAFVGGGISYECFDYDTEYSSWKDSCGEVIAWKEIVLPEEKVEDEKEAK